MDAEKLLDETLLHRAVHLDAGEDVGAEDVGGAQTSQVLWKKYKRLQMVLYGQIQMRGK